MIAPYVVALDTFKRKIVLVAKTLKLLTLFKCEQF